MYAVAFTLLRGGSMCDTSPPKWELQRYRAVTVREREWNERHGAESRINTGVYVGQRE